MGRRSVPLTHTCPRCGAEKSWWADRLPHGLCAACRTADKIAARDAEYHRRYHFENTYGITLEQRDEMIWRQGGRCAICNAETDLHVDHDHKTKRVRGMLCGRCNRGLGMFDDRTDLLHAASAYLQRLKLAA